MSGLRLLQRSVRCGTGAALIIVLLISCERRGWVERDGYAMDDLSGAQGKRELARLASSLARSRVVLIGEASHGAREFFILRDRLIRELVEHHGFSVVALEASPPDAVAIDAYVHGGEGDPRRLIPLLGFWTWNTAEFRDTLEWLRAASGRGRRISVAGLDSQSRETAAHALASALPTVDRALAERNERMLALLSGAAKRPKVSRREQHDLEESDHASMVELSSALGALSRTRPEAKELLLHARTLEQFMRIRRASQSQQDEVRETIMGENIAAILEDNPSARVIVLAHNGHISNKRPDIGWHLTSRGIPSVSVVMLFGSGRFNAVQRVQRQLSRGLGNASLLPRPRPSEHFITVDCGGFTFLEIRVASFTLFGPDLVEFRFGEALEAFKQPLREGGTSLPVELQQLRLDLIDPSAHDGTHSTRDSRMADHYVRPQLPPGEIFRTVNTSHPTPVKGMVGVAVSSVN